MKSQTAKRIISCLELRFYKPKHTRLVTPDESRHPYCMPLAIFWDWHSVCTCTEVLLSVTIAIGRFSFQPLPYTQKAATEAVRTYASSLKSNYESGMAAKMGMTEYDRELAVELLTNMYQDDADFTNTFRSLSDVSTSDAEESIPESLQKVTHEHLPLLLALTVAIRQTHFPLSNSTSIFCSTVFILIACPWSLSIT